LQISIVDGFWSTPGTGRVGLGSGRSNALREEGGA